MTYTKQQIVATYDKFVATHPDEDRKVIAECVAERLGIPYDDVKEAVIEDATKYMGVG